MPKFKELDANATLLDQMNAQDVPIVLIIIFTVSQDNEDALLKAWAHDAEFMKAQPGYISTQLHKGNAGSSTFIGYAIWQDVASFRSAFTNPEFQRRIPDYPESAVASPHLFKKLTVRNHCVA